MTRFYLGTHQQGWLSIATVPLFISRRRLEKLIQLPRAVTPWALDSGGFSEISLHGKWRTSESEYIDKVARYQDEIGRMDWAAPMDWMCEPKMIANTGLSVEAHQELTVENYFRLHETGLPFIPVLQGRPKDLDSYAQCIELYQSGGLDLRQAPLVGLGSVCRVQATPAIHKLISELHKYGLKMHGFGVKQGGLKMYRELLESCDSLAWSFNARQRWYHNGETYPGCWHNGCQNCIKWAMRWYRKIDSPLGGGSGADYKEGERS